MSEAKQDARALEFKKVLVEEGWLAWRVYHATILALQAGSQPRLLYVTSGAHPFAAFTPSKQRHLLQRAEKAGAWPQVVWWPDGGHPQRLDRNDWP